MKTRLLLIIIAVSAIISFGILPVYAYHDDRTSRGSDDPKITAFGDDTYVVWEESTDPQFWDVYFRKITNGNLEETINLTKGTSFAPRPQVLASENNVYVLWEDRQSSNGDDSVYFTKSNDGGKTFDDIKKLDPTNDGRSIYRPVIMKEANDILYVFGTHWNRDTNQNNLIYLTSQDNGDTFSEPTVFFETHQWDRLVRIIENDGAIYAVADDENSYDEAGSLNFRKISSDGTLGEILKINNEGTPVSNADISVSEDNVYVIWRQWVEEKRHLSFTKSSDSGNTFDTPKILDRDPQSLDIWSSNYHQISSHGDFVYVIWLEEYWDGENQTFKAWLAKSQNKGKSFDVSLFPLYEAQPHSIDVLMAEADGEFYFAIPDRKNPPYDDAAMYFTKTIGDGIYAKPIDIFQDMSVTFGQPNIIAKGNNIHIVTDGRSDNNCIFYSSSNDAGASFSNVINLSPNGDNIECLGLSYDIPSPIKQVKSGTEFQDIQCKEDRSKGYILALRERDGFPVCVTAKSYGNLMERGWLSENSDEVFALNAARKFIVSSPTFSFDRIDDTLELAVTQIRKSIPPVITIQGQFQSVFPGYGDRTGVDLPKERIYDHDLEIVVTQNNQIHTAVIDDEWNEIIQQRTDQPKPENLEYVHTGPTVNTVLKIGETVNSRGLLSVTITEKSENVSGSVTFWQFQPIGYHGDNRGKTWDTLPKDKRIGWAFLDNEGNSDLWDDSVIPRDSFGVTADLHIYGMFCNDEEKIEGESAHPSGIPIKPGIETAYATSGQKGILPDSNGVYTIQFVSLFETTVEFPDNVEIIENETTLCTMEEPREEATHGYYTKLIFKLNDNLIVPTVIPQIPYPDTNKVPSKPYDGAVLGDEHEHASILVKIFGDKFDFAAPKYQIMSSWIHFEGQDANTIHRHSKDVTLGYLFDTLSLGLSSECFVFNNGREFCTNEDYSLKFYINAEKVDDIRDYVISEDDRILISYGPENKDEIQKELAELEEQGLIF